MTTSKTNTEIKLRAEYYNGQVYSYYDKTKRACLAQLKKKFGNTKGFKLEYTTIIEESK